jgi:hypothetical protein
MSLVALIVVAPSDAAHAVPLDGDVTLLSTTATTAEGALDALHSWSGKAIVRVDGTINGSPPYRQETTVDFLCDCDHESARWRSVIKEQTGNDKADPRIASGILCDNKLFLMQAYVADEPRPGALSIKVTARPSDGGVGVQRLYDQFSPMQYYPQMNLNTATTLRWYRDHQHDPGFTGGTIKDTGTEVVLETVSAAAVNRFEFDKKHGCALAHSFLKGGGVEERCDVTFGSVNNVVVPTLYEYSHAIAPQGNGPAVEDLAGEVKFIEFQVNQPLAADAFGVSWLEPRDGDLVNDTTLGLTYLYKSNGGQPSTKSK